MRKITYCVIDDVQLPLLFSLGAEMEFAEKYGSVDKVLDQFKAEESADEKVVRMEIEKSMTPEQKKARDEKKKKSEEQTLLDILPECLAIMARQGQKYLGDAATITADWIVLHALPRDIEPMTVAMCKAIATGLSTRHEIQAGETDLVAEAIEKN